MVEIPSSKTSAAYCQKTLELFQQQVNCAKVQGEQNLPPIPDDQDGDQPVIETKVLREDDIRPLLSEVLEEKGYTINATEEQITGSFVDV